ncbi:hypothetical protein [Deinococcus hohokamensis]|uniref:Uncharacterized protein n=1 Tax=Deinococcus hohokamensis TaxID=309883 RepID=A0ABV9I5A4_9DEIO
MTRPHDRDPLQEAEYLRRLALGILGTLEHKGLLSATEVNAILRAAQQAAGAQASATRAPTVPAAPRPPAALGTQWVKPGQPYQPIDESTPILPPKTGNYQTQNDESAQAKKDGQGGADGNPPVPVFDMSME